MAVLEFLVSVVWLGTVCHCQDIYASYNPGGGGSFTQYAPSILPRGTPRLVPVKVRSSGSRLFPSFYYPALPPPLFRTSYHRLQQPSQHAQTFPQHYSQAQQQTAQASSMTSYSTSGSSASSSGTNLQAQSSTFPRLHHYFRPPGYYRPNRHLYYASPYQQHENTPQLAYQTAATVAPVVLKRGRVLPAPSPYSFEANSASAGGTHGVGIQHYSPPQSIPAVSTYRPPPQPLYSSQPQVLPHHVRVHHQPHNQQQLIQLQQPPVHRQPPASPEYYVQKSPVVVGHNGRPLKLRKAKKILAPTTVENAEEEYPSDPNPQYNFSFDIKDDELTNYQNRQEERDGQTIKGSYSVVDPDGYVRTVTYTADPKNGFQAKVTREPTDVKIKFPVPTEAPVATDQVVLKSGGQGRRQVYHHQPHQYQQAASYSSTREVFVTAPSPSVDNEVAAATPSDTAAIVVGTSSSAEQDRTRAEAKDVEHTRTRARILRKVSSH